VIGATVIPDAANADSTSPVNGRPALGISALPGSVENTFWYTDSGQSWSV
jgi:hypothetical protein